MIVCKIYQQILQIVTSLKGMLSIVNQKYQIVFLSDNLKHFHSKTFIKEAYKLPFNKSKNRETLTFLR